MNKYSEKIKLTRTNGPKHFTAFFCLVFLFIFAQFLSPNVYAENKPRVAILIPEKTEQASEIRNQLAEAMAISTEVLDFSLSEAVWNSKQFDAPYNLTLDQAKNVGMAIGCDFFLLLKTDTLTRISVETDNYVESYLALYLVSSRTGRLADWNLESLKGKNTREAKTKLKNSLDAIAHRIFTNLKTIQKNELTEEELLIEELPRENSPEAKGFRPPLPYKRLRPGYTDIAYLYSIAATIDVLVDIGNKGEVLRTEVIRWGGFSLDQSAIETIKKMNWRPAERNGKFLSMRILLRYNFKKIE
jgi:hypothetical protein